MSRRLIRMGYPLTGRGMYDDWGPGGLASATSILRRTGYLSAERLALLLEHNPDKPLPYELRHYLIRFLRGGLKQKRGRKARSVDDFYVVYAAAVYGRLLKEYSATETGRRRKGESHGNAAFDGAAGDVLDQIAALRHMEPQSLLNLLSKRRLLPNPKRIPRCPRPPK